LRLLHLFLPSGEGHTADTVEEEMAGAVEAEVRRGLVDAVETTDRGGVTEPRAQRRQSDHSRQAWRGAVGWRAWRWRRARREAVGRRGELEPAMELEATHTGELPAQRRRGGSALEIRVNEWIRRDKEGKRRE
jgi:hypothetical protein